jgi:hypothetical protein
MTWKRGGYAEYSSPHRHAHWIFPTRRGGRAVLDLQKGFGGDPRGLFPGSWLHPERDVPSGFMQDLSIVPIRPFYMQYSPRK